MNTIIKIYIYNVHTHETIQSNQNIEKLSFGKGSFKIINMCYDTIWTLLLQPYPNSTITSKIRKCFFLVPQFLGFIPQSSILRTQTIINIQPCPCWKVQVSSIKIFKIFFDMHHVLRIFSAGKFDNGPVTISTQSMTGFYFVPRNIYTNMVQNSADSGLQLIMFNWRRYAHNLLTFSTGVLCIFPALSFYWTQLLNQSIIHLLEYNDFWLKFF